MLVSLPPDLLLLSVAGAVFLYIVFRLARPDWALDLGGRLRRPITNRLITNRLITNRLITNRLITKR